jgi:WD40 repeat protein
VSFDVFGEAIGIGTSESKIHIYDVNTARKVREIPSHKGWISSLSFHRGKIMPWLLVSGSSSG